MAKAKDFLQALEASELGGESADGYWRRQRDAWIEDLRRLRSEVEAWLAPVCVAKKAEIHEQEFPLDEPDTGSYLAPGLKIELFADAPRLVLLRPRGVRVVGVVETGGARVVGASGRVDIECGVARETLLRFKNDDPTKRWVSFSRGRRRDLDEDVFFDLLARVAGVHLS